MPELPGGIVAFLFTDIEGSTVLLDELGKQGYAEALEEHRTILRRAFDRHAGVEIDTQGDAFFVGFPTASGAIAAAVDAQTELAKGPVRVRMGIHTGEPLQTGHGYVGIAVHRAARIAAVAHGAQVLVSDATRQLLDDDSHLRDLGFHRLKDLGSPQRLWQVGDDAFPPLRSLDGTNLPVPATPFLGREREVAAVVELLRRPGVRLVTLTGPGGTGKTRLALQAAAELADDVDDGVRWVPLSVVTDASRVPSAIAAAAGERLSENGDPVQAVAALLSGRRALLVLDNVEHVIDAAGDVARLVSACPDLQVLATSREPLAVAAEHQFPVPSLTRPEAVALFGQRALAIKPDFEDAEAVGRLCEQLDDLPLAIELAAARVRTLSPQKLVERLGQRLDLLKGGRDADPRQRTLRATIAWSHDLLDASERRLFASLSVFQGGCVLEDAETVTGADVDILAALVDKSLVRVRDERGVKRFWMLETIRAFASEQLEQLGDAAALRQRHADCYLGLAERSFLALQANADTAGVIDRVASEEGNLRTALATLRDGPDADAFGRLCAGLFFYWFFRGHPSEGVEWTRLALGRDVSEGLRSELENECAALFYLGGMRTGEARALVDASLRRARACGDEKRMLMALTTLGNIIFVPGATDHVAAFTAYEEALAIAVRLGEPWWERTLLSIIGSLHADSKRLDLGLEYLLRARELSVAAGDEASVAITTVHIAGLHAARQDWRAARDALHDALPSVVRLGLTPWLIEGLFVAAKVSHGEHSLKRAAQLVGHAKSTSAEMAIEGWVEFLELETVLREELGDKAYAAQLELGERLSSDEAVALALAYVHEP